jgi:hypothetical protein
VAFAPLLAKTLPLAAFSHHKLVKNTLGAATVTALILCIPKFFSGRSGVIAFLLLLPSFPFLHFTTISQCWMRRWYQVPSSISFTLLNPLSVVPSVQNTQKHHFSQEFIAKCTEIVWKELRYPLKTLIDYHEEYLSFTARCICASEIDSVTPALWQNLTTFK